MAQGSSLILNIDYECAGLIEICAYISLVLFYPLYQRKEKIKLLVAGVCWLYFANVLRLVIVTYLLHLNGLDYLFMAHSIIGRLIFYVLALILYYVVFTQPHIIKTFFRQK